MGKRLFWTFMLSVALVTAAAVIYIQSEAFARIVRRRLQDDVARHLGVELNFDRLKIGVLPPSVSLLNVDLKVSNEKNKLGLSPSTVFRAGSLGLTFRMIQAFSSGIAINKVFLSDAEVKLALPKSKDEGGGEKLSSLVHKPIRIELSRTFAATIRQLEVKNTKIDLTIGATQVHAREIEYLAVTPSSEGTNLVANIDDLAVESPKLKESLKAVKANLDVQRSLVLLSSLDVQRREAALHASGKLVGSVDNLVETRSDFDVILRGPMRELSDFEKSLGEFEGEVLADAKIVGRLKQPAVQGRVEISNFKHGLWNLDKVEVNGSYGDGLLVLDTLSLGAKGGRAFLKNKMEVPIPFQPQSAVFQLRLDNAHFEDFAGDLRKSVNNLQFQLDGVLNARLDFTEAGGKVKLGAITLKPDVRVKDLELNNQAYGKVRPYKRVFKAQPFQLNGNVMVKNGQLQVSNTKFTFASGVMDVSGTHTDAGYDLTGFASSVNLGTEVGQIGALPIQGDGSAKIHVHGPNDAVSIDFDIDQQNAKFAQFDLGKVTGQVVYDDKHDLILINGVKGRHGTAAFAVDGRVSIDDSDAISLNTAFENGAPDDLFAIFAHQLEKISWIPHGMTGTVSGKAKVGGKYTDNLNTLEIDAQVSGRNLSYLGETVHEVEAHAGVSKGVAFAHDVTALKYQTPITGNIDYDLRTDEILRYTLDATKGKLRNLDIFGATDLPLDGIFTFHSEGKGKWETLVSKSRFDVTSAFVRTRPVPPVSLGYDTGAESVGFSAKVGSTASLTGQVFRSTKGQSFAELSLQRANLDYLLCLLSRSNCTDTGLNFTASADGKVFWHGWDWAAMNGGGTLHDLQVGRTGYTLRVPTAVKVTAESGLMESAPGTLEGEDTKLSFRLRGRVDGTHLDNSLKGVASLKALEFLTPLIEEARGHMSLDLGVTGDVRDAIFRGSLAMDEGMLRLHGLDAPVDGLKARLRVAGSQVSIDKMEGQLGGGEVSARGGVDLYLNKPPHFSIDLDCSNNRIKFPFVTYAEVSNANLSFKGDAPPYLFSGKAHFKKVVMRNNFDLSGQKSLQNAKYLPEKVAGAKSFYEVRIRGIADNGIFVDNDLLNAEFQGEVTLSNNFEFPQVTGRADLVRGKLTSRNTTFTLDNAYVRLPNPEVFEPQFSISGVANVDVYRVNLFASGTVEHPKISLSSYPALPQEDIVSLLAFGYRGEDTRHVNNNDTSAITYSEVGSILMEQLQLSQSLQSKGLKFTVTPSVIDTEASLIRPNSAVTAAPKVSVQSQVVKNLDAALGGTVGAAQGQNMDARVEYHLNRRASVRGVYEQSASGIDASDTKNSYGADLRFRWEFK